MINGHSCLLDVDYLHLSPAGLAHQRMIKSLLSCVLDFLKMSTRHIHLGFTLKDALSGSTDVGKVNF